MVLITACAARMHCACMFVWHATLVLHAKCMFDISGGDGGGDYGGGGGDDF